MVLVDDHPAYARGLGMLFDTLTDDIKVAAICTDPEAAIDVISETRPDIVILDIRMPRREGLGLAKDVRHAFPDINVVMNSVSDDADDAYEAVKLGVKGYVSKLVEVEELMAALRMVHSGQIVVSPFVVDSLLTATHAGELSQEEVNILKLAAHGLDNAEIAENISVSNSTLKRMLQGTMKKLNVQNRTEAVAAAAKRGLL